MKNIFLSLIIGLSSLNGISQDKPDWENPEVFAIGKEDTRSTCIPYPSKKMAANNIFEKSPYYKSLNGIWQFYWSAKIADIPQNFFKESYQTNEAIAAKPSLNIISGSYGWTAMTVPGNWEMNGFGIPIYVNIGFGFPKNPPFINREDSPSGAYRHYFNIPKDWAGRKIFLHFEGGTNSMYVWINGTKVGYTENAKSPAEFDITSYIRPGQNLLACEVHKFSDGTYLEDQDMWRLGGINRNVFLYSTASTRIQDFFAHADLDASYTDGLFSADVKIRNYSDQSAVRMLEVNIFDKVGKKCFSQTKKLSLAPLTIDSVGFEGILKYPLQWTAETPHLYNMVITLKNEKDQVVEATSHKIGFRKIEVKDGNILINGKKILFKGVNLHEFNFHTGQVVDSAVMMRNIRLFKELNINAVRTSHYPQPPLWYRMCDEYGIYLVNEANLESHGLGFGPENVSNFPQWQEAHLDRMKRLVERDKNHASVIFWSLGNEAGNGKAFFAMYDWAKSRDKSRPVQYEQAGKNDRNTDIICPMYPSWESMVGDAKKELGKPYIMCEYSHAMGNSMGNFQEYWDLIRSSKNMQGGFIWEWYNHGYPARDEQGRSYWAYGGDLQGYNKPNDGNFCMDGIISPDQQYLPHTGIVKKVYQNILFESKSPTSGIITIINDFKFTRLTSKNYTYRWILLKNGDTLAVSNFNADVPPDSRKDVQLHLPQLHHRPGVEYVLQIYAYTKENSQFLQAGYESAKAEFILPGYGYLDKDTTENNLVSKTEESNKVIFTAGAISYEFFKSSEGLSSITTTQKSLFSRLPQLNFWRAPTDNDFGENLPSLLRVWDAASSAQKTTFLGIEEKNGVPSVHYEVTLPGIDAKVNLSYTINKNGSLTVAIHYKAASDDVPEMMRLGMTMELGKEYNNFSWYGRGPGESYTDRKQDAFLAIWKRKVEDQFFAYYRPQETGNKTDVRWLTLTDANGKGIRIVGNENLNVSALKYRTEDLDPGKTKKQQHPSDLIAADGIVIHIDLFQRGVGGLNSWGASPLDLYRYREKEYKYAFNISMD